MKNIFIITLFSIGLLTSCRDKDQDTDTLPEATQSGKNTGGALVDGQVWVAKIENPELANGGIYATIYNEAGTSQYFVQISLRNVKNLNSRIQMNILIPQSTPLVGNHILNEPTNNKGHYYGSKSFFTDSINSGILNITKLDKTKNIISGTFHFKAKTDDGEIVNITDGRFDKKFL